MKAPIEKEQELARLREICNNREFEFKLVYGLDLRIRVDLEWSSAKNAWEFYIFVNSNTECITTETSYEDAYGYIIDTVRIARTICTQTLRMRELVETMSSYLSDNDLLEDYKEDRDIEFSLEEEKYLFPEEA